jgi:hypothetical protein
VGWGWDFEAGEGGRDNERANLSVCVLMCVWMGGCRCRCLGGGSKNRVGSKTRDVHTSSAKSSMARAVISLWMSTMREELLYLRASCVCRVCVCVI